MNMFNRCLLISLLCCTAGWTTELNQITLPDIQPAGVDTVSYQQLTNNEDVTGQLQYEVGLTNRSEITIAENSAPFQTILSAEYNVVKTPTTLFSVGVNNVAEGAVAEPFIVAGYTRGRCERMGVTPVLFWQEEQPLNWHANILGKDRFSIQIDFTGKKRKFIED